MVREVSCCAYLSGRILLVLAHLICVGILLMLISNVIVLPAILKWLDDAPASDHPSARP